MEDSAAAIIYHGMTFHVVVLCCVTLFLLLVSALVSGSETAFFSLSGNDVRFTVEEIEGHRIDKIKVRLHG